jgi:hypothetical protein
MSNFQLDNYELANDTIKRFWTEYPVGRIVPMIVDIDLVVGYVLFKVDIYREYGDLEPVATGHAYGNVAFYPANMKKWFIEDTETSAIARAIKLLTPSAERPSREDMQKVETLAPMPDVQDFWATKPETAGIPLLAVGVEALDAAYKVVKDSYGEFDKPLSCTHGLRVFRKGKADEWGAYFCPQPKGSAQCAPVWCEIGTNGKWQVKV